MAIQQTSAGGKSDKNTWRQNTRAWAILAVEDTEEEGSVEVSGWTGWFSCSLCGQQKPGKEKSGPSSLQSTLCVFHPRIRLLSLEREAEREREREGERERDISVREEH